MYYLMDSASEGTRLRAKTDPGAVAEELELTGLAEGARALDAGCASGAVTLSMAERVGARGAVTGVDLSVRRLRESVQAAKALAAQGLACPVAFAAGDLRTIPLRSGSMDYSLCRLVLEYVPEPLPLVCELVRVTRPGGKVVLTDVDGYFAWHHPLTDERKSAVDALQRVLAKGGFDPFVGRKLPSLLRDAGAQSVRVTVRPYHLKSGAPTPTEWRNWNYKLDTLEALGRNEHGAAWAGIAQTLREIVADPQVLTYSVLFVVEGSVA